MRWTKDLRKAQAELDRFRDSLGDSDPSTLIAAIRLADEYDRCKDQESARELLEQSLAAYGPWDGDDCYEILRVAHRLGYLRSGLGSLDSAREIQERVLTSFRRKYGDQSPVTISAIHNLALTTLELADYPEAIALATEELRLREETVGEHDEATVVAMCRLGVIYLKSGDCQQARILHENAVDLSSVSFPRSRLQIDAMRLLFDDLRASKEKKDWLEAVRLAQEIQDMAKEVLDPEDSLAVRLRRLRWMGPLLRYINWPDARNERAERSVRGDLDR